MSKIHMLGLHSLVELLNIDILDSVQRFDLHSNKICKAVFFNDFVKIVFTPKPNNLKQRCQTLSPLLAIGDLNVATAKPLLPQMRQQ